MRGSRIIAALRAFAGNKRGNIAINLALALPLLLAALGAAFDVAAYTSKKSMLQAASDAAAEAAAQQLAVASTQTTAVVAVAQAFLKNQLTGDEATATNTITVDPTAGTVTVQLSESWTPVLAHYLNASITPIVTTSVAQLQGETRICILSLNPSDTQAYRMLNSATVNASTCGIYSNSTDKQGMLLANSSVIKASMICSAGGISASAIQTSVPPETDCPPIPDPLATLAPPPVGACTSTNLVIANGIVTLSPGVYCGGITIKQLALVKFNPGIYVIKDGPLQLGDITGITGKDVGFYLTGTGAVLNFSGNSGINLSGAETGPMAGLLFFADRAQPDGTQHRIGSVLVSNLTGTIYLPTGDLTIDPNAPVGGNSAYTAIVANRLRINNSANLVLNTNYAATNVPVPSGIHSAARVVLAN